MSAREFWRVVLRYPDGTERAIDAHPPHDCAESALEHAEYVVGRFRTSARLAGSSARVEHIRVTEDVLAVVEVSP